MLTAVRVIGRSLAALIGSLALLTSAAMIAAMITFSTGLMATIPGLVHVLPGATEPSATITAEPLAPLWIAVAALGFAVLDRHVRRSQTVRRRIARANGN